ncbi:restriction endonuclease subunit S [Marinobacter sp.]|uniref:restriction endonuclease subunit S n=1 Tax=Marinobacter sp. TaxID=50741 RepID=UPI003A91946D
MLPEGWVYTTFEDHIDLLSGYPFKSDEYTVELEDIKILRGDNIEPGALRWRDARRWPRAEYDKLKKFQLHTGDFIIAMDRTWVSSGLKVAEVKESDLPCLLVQRVSRVRAKPSLEQGLLRQYFSSHKFEQYVKSVQTETAVPHISAAQIKEFPVLLPPISEQKKIAQILSTWDNAISATERLLENSQQRKKGLMQQLLTGKKRLPGFEGEWQWLRANEVFRTVSKKNNGDHEELLAVTQDQGALPRSLLERRVVMPDGSTSGYKLVVPGNFIISLRSFQGGLEYSEYRGLVSPAYTVLEPTREINDAFYKQYYKSYDFIGHLAVAVIGIRDGKQISYSDFSFLKIPYPDIVEQQAIANVLTTADHEIEALQKRLDHLKQEKKALMQQLLTGKRRVQVDDAA